MQYRKLGRSDIQVSEIGLGCEGFLKGDEEAEKMFSLAEEGGVNFLDMYSPNPVFRDFVGRMIARSDRHLALQGHLCAVWQNGEYLRSRDPKLVREGFEDLMLRLGEDSIDIGMIHYVDSIRDWNEVKDGEVMRIAKELRDAGRIRLLGLSSHNPDAALEAVSSGLIDVLMFSVNPVYDAAPPDEDVEKLWADETYAETLTNMDPATARLYETCQEKGIAITVMKAFGGGDLLSAEESPAGAALTADQCIAYALDRPAVSSVMVGARTIGDIETALKFETASAEDKDYAEALRSFPKISWHGHCMYCGHCAPCPQHISVADVLKLYSLAKGREEIPETVADHYRLLAHHASDCTQCGACEKRCPFGVKVREEMKRTEELFGE